MTTLLQRLIEQDLDGLLADWRLAVQTQGGALRTQDGGGARELEARLRDILDEVRTLLAAPPGETFVLNAEDPRTRHLRDFVARQAKLDSQPLEIAETVSSLKRLLVRRLNAMATELPTGDHVAHLLWLDQVFDALGRLAFEAFVGIRERVITQQSLSLLELSTPVLRLWHRVLLLPLVGVVDTARARQFTERLLEAVARHEALVTVIDISGVPILDTSVAQHLMKTIDASRLLGTRIVMTGISPEGAQTLTKLGIRFSDVVSRSSLRAGIAEALAMVGQRIVPLEEQRR